MPVGTQENEVKVFSTKGENRGLVSYVNNVKNKKNRSNSNSIKVETKDLCVCYGSKQALANVNMRVVENEVTALIGPSGCGKTTFLRSINRMNDLIPSSKIKGKVFFDGEDIYRAGLDVVELRRRIGLVFQQPNPFPKSIYENVVYGPRIYGVKKRAELDQITEEALTQAALWDEVKDRLKESALSLSGGQQQRLCIARVLAVRPEVILMDEPTSALDPIATQRVEDLVRELSNSYTIVIVTHNMQQAARISDTTAFFLLGELLEWGETSKIFTSPNNIRTEEYITGRFG